MSKFWEIIRWLILLAALASLVLVLITTLWGWGVLDAIELPKIEPGAVAGYLIFFGVPASLGMAFLIFLWAEAVHHIRRRRGQRIVAYVEAAVRLSAPLPEMVRAMAPNEKHRVAARLDALAAALARGEPLADAFRSHIPEIPVRQTDLIAVAERTGCLRQTLADLVAANAQTEPGARHWIDWLYPMAVTYVLALVLSGSMIFVVPKFQEIFRDFDTNLPGITQHLLNTADWVAGRNSDQLLPGWVFILPLVFLGIGGTLWMFVRIFRLPRTQRYGLRAALAEVAMAIPFLGPAVRDRQLADVCYAVAGSVRAAVPLPSALMEGCSLHLAPSLRHAVLRWADAVRTGQPADLAARQAGLPPLLVGMLATGQASAQPAEAFDFLHRYYANRFSRFTELARGALVPAAVLTMGTIVALFVLGLFLPLVALINSVIAQ